MKISNIILAGMFACNVAIADCGQPVSYLKQGQPASCTGYLFSPEKEKEVRDIVQKYPVMVELNSKQEELINTLDEQVKLNQQISMNLRQELRDKEKNQTTENIIYFALGFVLAVGFNKINK